VVAGVAEERNSSSTTASPSSSTKTSRTTRFAAPAARSPAASTHQVWAGRRRHALEHGGIDIEEIGELVTKNATRWRTKHYAIIARADFFPGQQVRCTEISPSLLFARVSL
jgi:hypothetical protein